LNCLDEYERQKASLDKNQMASFDEVFSTFVLHQRGFEAHRSRLQPGAWRRLTQSGVLKMKRCLLKGSKNKNSPLEDSENLLTGYSGRAEPCLVMPRSWFDTGFLDFCIKFISQL
jgi:hypothetical protein